MGNSKWTEDHFRKRVKDQRDALGWTQEELAKRLRERGLTLHWTTVAKIEKGDRSVRIDEAAAMADLFDTSLDVLLGRELPDNADAVANELRVARHTATKAQLDIQSLQVSLSDTAARLFITSAFGDAATLADGCRRAVTALGRADRALSEALAEAGGIAK